MRCDRPICPDCMHPASVGFQCPECVREGNKGLRETRTTFGGRVSPNERAVSVALIGLTVAVYLLAAAADPIALTRATPTPLHDRFALVGAFVAQGQYYRLLTSAFLHYGPLHIAFNMYALWLFGPELERLYGRARFLGLYVLSAVGGGALAYLIINPGVQLAGASGAVFGLLGAYFVTARKIGARTGGIVALLGINLALGFVIPNIGWEAHVGGLVTGSALAAVLAYAPRGPRRVPVQVAGAVLIVVVIVAVVALRTAQIPH